MRLNRREKVSLAGVALTMLLAAQPAQAVGVIYQYWHMQPEGQVSDSGRELDLRGDLNLSNESSHGWHIDADWLQLGFEPMDFAARAVLEQEANFGGSTFTSDSEIQTTTELDDLSAGYTWWFADWGGVGGTLKIIDGEIVVEEVGDGGGGLPLPLPGLGGDDEPQRESETVSEVFPMLTLSGRYALTTVFELAGQVGYITYDDDEVLEMRFAVSVPPRSDDHSGLGMSLGWLDKRYDVSDGQFTLDSRISGLYARFSAYF